MNGVVSRVRVERSRGHLGLGRRMVLDEFLK